MRRLLVLALASALSFGEDDPDLERAVEDLVRQLGSPSPDERAAARARLADYGERIIPLLQRFTSDDPEVSQALHVLTAPARTVRLLLTSFARPQPIGSAVELHVVIENNTDETFALLPPEARRGALSPFEARVERAEALAVPFRFDEVRWGTLPGGASSREIATLRPRESVGATLTIDSRSALLRRPAVCEISVSFRGIVRHGHGDLTAEGGDWREMYLTLESDPIEIHVLGRKPEELEQALRSGDAALRAAAVVELSLREDEAVIPLLRRHAHERALRLAAVRRLARNGADEDFDLVMEATRDEDNDVRRAAVLGLRHYPGPRARRRLGALAWDLELQHEAIQALRGHKHAATIDLFVGLLAARNCRGESVREMRDAISEWTGLWVDDRVAEVEAFKAWWEANRADWVRKNATDR